MPTAADAFSPLKLHFSNFSIEILDQSKRRRLTETRKFFPDAMFDECLIEREYQQIPPAPHAYSGFGAIPNDAEDLLLLLRLFRPGDVAFVSLSIEKAGSPPSKQYPYRAISNSVFNSSRPFRIDLADVPEFEVMASSLKSSASWNSSWFSVARRWFLYGGAKEFNPNFESDVDRVADNMAALEATFVPKSDLFVQRQLKERAVRLLGLSDEETKATKKILTRFYKIRSTLVHGSPVSGEDLAYLQNRELWREFEKLVRDLLRAALLKICDVDLTGWRSECGQWLGRILSVVTFFCSARDEGIGSRFYCGSKTDLFCCTNDWKLGCSSGRGWKKERIRWSYGPVS